MGIYSTVRHILVAGLVLAGASCGGDDDTAQVSQTFALRFAAVDGNNEVGCGDQLAGLGANGDVEVEISDLRFYVSNIRFATAGGGSVEAELDANDFQYTDEMGSVALVDLTGTDEGACSGDGITFPEGTARRNDVIRGMVASDAITGVSFDVGIPQPLMKKIIANNTAEDAPSPFAELHWSWAFAYRFFVMNFVIRQGASPGEGYLHVGSSDCGGDGTKALTDRDACGLVNAPTVSLDSFDPATDTIAIDLRAVLAHLDFQVSTEEATVTGVECHSSPAQPDCELIFGNFGIDMDSGTSSANLDTVFEVQ